jgi:DNA integrity scanning protein DisA with diadenylate cyclase activity
MLQEAMAESRAQTGVREIENMPDEWSQLLEDAGYDDLDSIINASVEDLTAIEGVAEEMAAQIIELARKHEQVEESPEEESEEEASDEEQAEASVE